MLFIFILTIITSTFMLILSSTPIILGINILIMSLVLATTFAYTLRSWFAFLVFLIYVGGILVIFAYFLALTPNQQISSINIWFHYIISILTFSIVSYISNVKLPIIIQFYQGNMSLYLYRTSPFLIILAVILLLTIIVVVKITSRSRGPLRPFN